MENFVVEIEAGVLLNDLAEDCQSKGMLYPPVGNTTVIALT